MESVRIVHSEVVEKIQRAAFAVARVNDSQDRTVSARNASSMSRIPFRVSAYHTGLTCRFVETAEAVVTVFKAKHFAATITLTQAVIVTAAAVWQLYETVRSSIEQEDLGLLDQHLRKVFTGDARDRQAGIAVSTIVSSFIRHAESDVPGFEQLCERFLRLGKSEWSGTGQLYAAADSEGCAVQFRHRLTREDQPIELMADVLYLTALAYEHFSIELLRAMPSLKELDEKIGTDDRPGSYVPGVPWTEKEWWLV